MLLLLSFGYCYYYGPLVIFTKKNLTGLSIWDMRLLCLAKVLKYVDAQRRSIFKAMSQSWGNSGINATQNDEREEGVNRCLSLLSLFSSKSCSCMTARLIPNPGEWTVVVFEIGPKLILQRWKVISSWFLICMASCCHLLAPRHTKHTEDVAQSCQWR